MGQKIYQVDAFADQIFSGNPAAVCPLEQWLSDDILQKIAMENNLAETAFYVKVDNQYELRWFTPTVEVDLCGHATLAAACVIFNHENFSGSEINFHSHRSGPLSVSKEGEFLTLNFPADTFKEIELTEDLLNCFDLKPISAIRGKTDYLLIYNSEEEIKNIVPNYRNIEVIEARGIIVSAKGDTVDFVSRFFAPQSGVDEDPVTGSAHTTLTPYWSKALAKKELNARQISKRGGSLKCVDLGERVAISGQAKLYLIGDIFI